MNSSEYRIIEKYVRLLVIPSEREDCVQYIAMKYLDEKKPRLTKQYIKYRAIDYLRTQGIGPRGYKGERTLTERLNETNETGFNVTDKVTYYEWKQPERQCVAKAFIKRLNLTKGAKSWLEKNLFKILK